MNFRMVFKIIGRLMILMGILIIIPFIISLATSDGAWFGFLIPFLLLIVIGISLALIKTKSDDLGVKDGLLTVSLSWIILSLVGTLPYLISRQIPSFIDALFESVSGFTTTCATTLAHIEDLTLSVQFWRAFSQWIGGCGVLSVAIALAPKSKENSAHVLRAESTGFKENKLVSKVKVSTRILIIIYVVFTLAEFLLLLPSGISVFDSVTIAFSTLSTGGFIGYSNNMAHFNNLYVEIIVGIFLILASLNFTVYYLIIAGKFSRVLKNEEIKCFFIMMAVSIIILTSTLYASKTYESFTESLRYSAFHAVSMSSTAGFFTTNLGAWPAVCQMILMLLVFVGGSAGSTAGGIKISRLIVLFKSGYYSMKKAVKPNTIYRIKFNGETLGDIQVGAILNYVLIYLALAVVSFIAVSLSELVSSQYTYDMLGNLSSVIYSLSNTSVASGSYTMFNPVTKLILSFNMLAGRLELYPILLLFFPPAWKK